MKQRVTNLKGSEYFPSPLYMYVTWTLLLAPKEEVYTEVLKSVILPEIQQAQLAPTKLL